MMGAVKDKIMSQIQQLLLMCYMLQNEYISCLHLKHHLNYKNQISFLMIPNGKEDIILQ